MPKTPNTIDRKARTRTTKLITVIQVEVSKGAGTPEDPNRIITEYWSLRGELLAVYDPMDYDEEPFEPW